jgi:hypothetical protein
MIAIRTHRSIILKRESILKQESYVVKKRTLLTKFKKPKQSVQFASKPSSVHSSPKNVSRVELQSRWYDNDELATFKRDVFRQAVYTTNHVGSHALPRGMEGCTKERQKHRANTVRCIVVADKLGKTSDDIAELSRTCSGWNVELAYHQACRGFFEIYNPAMLSQIQPVLTKAPKIAFVRKARGDSSTVMSSPTI